MQGVTIPQYLLPAYQRTEGRGSMVLHRGGALKEHISSASMTWLPSSKFLLWVASAQGGYV